MVYRSPCWNSCSDLPLQPHRSMGFSNLVWSTHHCGKIRSPWNLRTSVDGPPQALHQPCFGLLANPLKPCLSGPPIGSPLPCSPTLFKSKNSSYTFHLNSMLTRRGKEVSLFQVWSRTTARWWKAQTSQLALLIVMPRVRFKAGLKLASLFRILFSVNR
jgi:hypothetical protein